jgi:hypothetical protein
MQIIDTVTVLDFACTTCGASATQGCITKSGKPAGYHVARTALFESERAAYLAQQAEAIVPVQALPPVKALKEKFTLKGEPLSLSTCMRKLHLEIDDQGEKGIFCEFEHKPNEYSCFVFNRKDLSWSFGQYGVDDENWGATKVSEADVIFAMLKRYYTIGPRRRPSSEVLSSLSARLLPLVNTQQLDTLRAELRGLFRARV